MNRMALLAGLCMAVAVPAAAQNGKTTPAGKAPGGLTLDLGSVSGSDEVTGGTKAVPGSTAPVEVFTMPRLGSTPIAAAANRAMYTLDTPIVRLLADARSKAVLDKVLPGLSDDENLPRFQKLSLRAFQPLTGGQLTPALLKQAEIDLAAIGPASTKGRNAAR